VSAQLGLLLGASKLGSQEEALGTLLQAFTDLVFDPELVREGRSVVRARARANRRPSLSNPKSRRRSCLLPNIWGVPACGVGAAQACASECARSLASRSRGCGRLGGQGPAAGDSAAASGGAGGGADGGAGYGGRA